MKSTIKLLLTLFMLIAWKGIGAQNLPNTGMFYSNPYFYNPAFVGGNTMLEVNTNYRMQWVDVNNAPKIMHANIQYASKAHMKFGASVFSEENVGLKTTTAYFTTAYQVKFNPDNDLTFGLSVGAIQNTIDQNILGAYPEILEDPAIRNAVNNTYYFSSQLGLKYRFKDLIIGVALPKLLENNAFSNEAFNKPSFEQLNQFITSISYSASINDKILFKPVALLRYNDRNNYQAELSGIFQYNEMIWLGGGYRYQAGVLGHIGLQLKDNIAFAYAYEDAGIQARTFGGATHEINIKFTLKRKLKEKRKETYTEVLEEQAIANHTTKLSYEKEEKEEPQAQPIDSVVFEETKKSIEPEKKIDSSRVELEELQKVENAMDLLPGYYVVVGVFNEKDNAYKQATKIKEQGFSAEVYFDSQKEYYYVSLLRTNDLKKATEKRNYVRQLLILNFSDAWLMEINN